MCHDCITTWGMGLSAVLIQAKLKKKKDDDDDDDDVEEEEEKKRKRRGRWKKGLVAFN